MYYTNARIILILIFAMIEPTRLSKVTADHAVAAYYAANMRQLFVI